MRILIVEDDFVGRMLLQRFLSPYGVVDIAVDGEEALGAFNLAWEEGAPYGLICLDIMMPKMNGQHVLKKIREGEERLGVEGHAGVKIVMTTALGDKASVLSAFRAQCDGYIVKPLDKEKVISELSGLGIKQPTARMG